MDASQIPTKPIPDLAATIEMSDVKIDLCKSRHVAAASTDLSRRHKGSAQTNYSWFCALSRKKAEHLIATHARNLTCVKLIVCRGRFRTNSAQCSTSTDFDIRSAAWPFALSLYRLPQVSKDSSLSKMS